MKRRLGLFLAVLIGFAVMAGLAFQDDQGEKQEQYKKAADVYKDLINRYPPGVSSQNWIPLTANVGIVVKPATSSDPGRKPAFTGTIMFRPTSNSAWQVLMLDNPVRQIPIRDK